ncbi:MAG: DUF493 domain-containing protein [Arenicellales bacterium]
MTAKKIETCTDEAPGMVFPCEIDVKIFVKNQDGTEIIIKALVCDKLAPEPLKSWAIKHSSGGKYLSITVGVEATCREQMDALYQALVDHDLVAMVI